MHSIQDSAVVEMSAPIAKATVTPESPPCVSPPQLAQELES